MASFDSASKRLVQKHPRDFVAFAFKRRNIAPDEFSDVELITPEVPTVEMHQADVLIKVKLRGKYVLVHFEIQTTDSFDPPMALRMAGYIIRLVETYRMDVYSHVIYLRPDAGRNDPGLFVQDIAGQRILVEYQVIRLADLDGQAVLDAKHPGLLPFTPLMQPPVDVNKSEWLRRCIATVDSLDVPNKLDTLGVLAVLGNALYDNETILNTIRRITMNAAPIVQYVGAQAANERAREDILKVLEVRLHPTATHAFKSTLDTIENAQQLEALLCAAALADSVEEFRQFLEANGN